ncbi:MAG: TRAP transporter permease [Hyphomicrobiaceae bacterium]
MAEGEAEKSVVTGWAKWPAIAMAVVLTLAALAWAADLYRQLDIVLIEEQFNAVILALSLGLVFLSVRFRSGRSTTPPWYDVLAAVLGFIAALYVALHYRELDDSAPSRPLHAIVIGGILLVLVLEGLRRVAGGVLASILLVFIGYGLFGHLIPGPLQGRQVDWQDLLLYLSLDVNGVFGSVFGVAATVVVAFLFFGALLSRSGGSQFFTDIAIALMGNLRGGGAKIAIVSSSLFGTISGNAVSNVVTTGVVSIPLMKASGYKPEHAGAIEAVASTGGQLMPPVMGAAAFIMAELLAVPYGTIVVAATIPALLYYVSLFIQADLEAAKGNFKGVALQDRKPPLRVLIDGWFFPVPFAVVVYALFWGNESPETAALYASAALIVCGLLSGYAGKRMSLRDVGMALVDTGRASIEILMIAAAAGFIIGILNVTGLNFALTSSLVALGKGNLPLLLVLAALISIVLGMGMPTVAVYVLLAALVAPGLIEAGVTPIAAHLFVMYFGMMSMTTPPVAVAAYAAASIARADSMRTGLAGVKFGWSAYIVPFLFVSSSELLMNGTPLAVLQAVFTAVMGVYLVSVGVAGFMTRPIGWLHRLAFVVSGIAMMIPAGAFPGAVWTDIVGFIVGVALLSVEIAAGRARKREAVAA